jgi:addiction module RelE/StbE family toxin
MGTFQVVFTPRAERDLEKIVRYIARDDPEAAERLGLELADRALSLAQPHVHRSGGHLPQRPGVRKIMHGRNYLILYRIIESQQKVRVLRFWHGAQDRDRLQGL